MTITVAALTSGANVPSARFRVRQFIDPLREHGIVVSEYAVHPDKYAPVPRRWASLPSGPRQAAVSGWKAWKVLARTAAITASWRADVTWLERELIPGRLTLEHLLGRPFVFDVDDAIWLTPPRGARAVAAIARRASAIFAGNRFLADYLTAYNDHVVVVPTAIDTARFTPRRAAHRDRLVVGWTGSRSTLRYLQLIEAPLANFLHESDAELLVVADARPDLPLIEPSALRFIEWSPEIEAGAVRTMDIGLMPLADDVWSRGKCSGKFLQYMASGVPAVVTPVGMNAELLAKGTVGVGASSAREWRAALDRLRDDVALRHTIATEARRLVERSYSIECVGPVIAGELRQLAAIK